MRMADFKAVGVFWLAAGLTALTAQAAVTNSLVAWFRFDGDGQDSLGRCPAVEQTNIVFADGAALVNGQYEHGGGPAPCRLVAIIPGLSYESFTVSFDFLPRDLDSSRPTR